VDMVMPALPPSSTGTRRYIRQSSTAIYFEGGHISIHKRKFDRSVPVC
jgi:hypothetical protein